jgi:cytochrome c peroxidase
VYMGQEAKGIFRRVDDPEVLAQIDRVGKLLFYDPILSANDQRSCASCHKPNEYFTDTTVATAPSFDHVGTLPRNTPTLLNASYNHLLMLDGKHIDLQAQAHGVIGSASEMGGSEADMLKKVLSCPDYRTAFKTLVKHTPEQPEVTMDHVVSAITFYYNKFSSRRSPFDQAVNTHAPIDAGVHRGFNLFMSKAQCATCHFVPQFNGVKPPFIGSEFEVVGVPEDTAYHALSDDQGRYLVNPADETLHAFRTGSLRNIAHTGPYMHNGVFTSLRQVMDFYDNGGGAGKHLDVPNQTLSADPLKLTQKEKDQVIAFLGSLTEDIAFDGAPATLPRSKIKTLNTRKPGGEY